MFAMGPEFDRIGTHAKPSPERAQLPFMSSLRGTPWKKQLDPSSILTRIAIVCEPILARTTLPPRLKSAHDLSPDQHR
jgi:hypothetical protein